MCVGVNSVSVSVCVSVCVSMVERQRLGVYSYNVRCVCTVMMCGVCTDARCVCIVMIRGVCIVTVCVQL